jgi:heterodisulfide reductase subunit C2
LNARRGSVIVPLCIAPSREDAAFVADVERISGAKLLACYQCGNCSAGCPMSAYMDILPSRIVRMVQLGMREALYASDSIWTCVSCMTCNTRCPKGVRIAEVIEAVREIALRTNRREDRLQVNALTPDALAKLPPIALIGSMRKLTS